MGLHEIIVLETQEKSLEEQPVSDCSYGVITEKSHEADPIRSAGNIKYSISYKTFLDGKIITLKKYVPIGEFIKTNIGDTVQIKVYSGGKRLISSTVDPEIEKEIGPLIHPTLKEVLMGAR